MRAFLVILISAACLLFISQLFRFQNSLEIEVLPNKALLSFNNQPPFELDIEVGELKQLQFVFQKAIAGESGLASIVITDPISDKVLYERSPSVLYIFGVDLLGNLLRGPPTNIQQSLGDWSIDRINTAPLDVELPPLPTHYKVAISYLGRGDKFLTLLRTEPIHINLREGYIDSDYSVCDRNKCYVTGALTSTTWTNLSRIVGFFCQALLAALIIITSLPLLRTFRPYRAASHSLAPPLLLVYGASFFVTLLALWFAYSILGGVPHIPDSAVYFRQARMLAAGLLDIPAPTFGDLSLFLTTGAIDQGERIIYHYNRIWPAILACAEYLGAQSLLNPICAGFSVLLTYRIASRLYDSRHGYLAALLAATSPFVAIMAGDFMNHSFTGILILLCTDLLLIAVNQKSLKHIFLAGLVWSIALTIRTGTTAAIAIPLTILVLSQRRYSPTWSTYLWFMIGGVVPIAFYLADNHSLTGAWYISPYSKFHGLSLSIHNLNLGVGFASATLAYLYPILFGPALQHLMWGLILLPLCWRPSKIEFSLFGCLVSLILLQCILNSHGMHGYGPRFFYEASFFLFILAARGVGHLVQTNGRTTILLCTLLAAANVCTWLPTLKTYQNYNGVNTTNLSVLHRLESQSPIFVTDPSTWQNQEIGVSIWDPNFEKNIFITQKQNNEHLKVLAKFPERTSWLINSAGIAPYLWWNDPAATTLWQSNQVEVEKPAEKQIPTQNYQNKIKQALHTLAWYLSIQLIAIIVFPWIGMAFPSLPDAGFGVSKCLGLLILGWIAYQLQSTEIIYSGPVALWAVLLLFAAASFTFYRILRPVIARDKISRIVTAEILFSGVFLLFTVIKAFNPEIYWGEKPMDASFLQYFSRLDSLPPQDPWAAGLKMQYYFFGSYIFALLCKLTATPVPVGYNLALITVAATLVVSLYGLNLLLTKRLLISAISALLITLGSNFEWIRLYFFEGKVFNFDFFWATTRLFTPPAFAEYPIWSFLFGDLHAHYMALPLLVVFFTLVTATIWFERVELDRPIFKSCIGRITLLGFVWGSFLALNAWDYLYVTVVAMFASAIYVISAVMGGVHIKAMWKNSQAAFLTMVAAGLMSTVVTQSLLDINTGVSRVGWGWIVASESITWTQLCLHFGPWLLLGFAGISSTLLPKVPFVRRLKILIISGAIVALLANLYHRYGHGTFLTQPSINFITLTLLAAVSLYSIKFHKRSQHYPAAIALFTSALFMLGLGELFFIGDRMNSVFKLSNSLWLLFSASACAIAYLSLSLNLQGRFSPTLWLRNHPFVGFLIISGSAISLIGGIIAVCIMVSFNRVEGPRPTLAGDAWISRSHPDEAALINWINTSISGTPSLLEAHGAPYQDFSRIVMHTGLPTLLGWAHHVGQRGIPEKEVQTRETDINSIYNSPDLELSLRLLKKYNIRYVVVGKLERQTYVASGLDKFDSQSEHFKLRFQQNETALYEVNFN